MAAREGEILHLFGTEFYRDYGWDEQRSWLTLRWIEGTGLWTEFERAYQGDRNAAAKAITYTDPAAGRMAQLKDITAAGPLNPRIARPWPFTEFEEAVMACMATDPCECPTVEHVATALR